MGTGMVGWCQAEPMVHRKQPARKVIKHASNAKWDVYPLICCEQRKTVVAPMLTILEIKPSGVYYQPTCSCKRERERQLPISLIQIGLV